MAETVARLGAPRPMLPERPPLGEDHRLLQRRHRRNKRPALQTLDVTANRNGSLPLSIPACAGAVITDPT